MSRSSRYSLRHAFANEDCTLIVDFLALFLKGFIDHWLHNACIEASIASGIDVIRHFRLSSVLKGWYREFKAWIDPVLCVLRSFPNRNSTRTCLLNLVESFVMINKVLEPMIDITDTRFQYQSSF
jgi:hypothetical protein